MPVLQKRIHSWLVGLLGAGMVRALHATWRVQQIDVAGGCPGIQDGSAPGIVAFWHRHILSLLAHYRGFHVCVPVSEHQDGEYVAQVMERFGFPSVRGSTTRGSLKLIRGMLARIRDGWSPAITPDGPRGPKFSVQPGVALLAERSRLPVYPVGVAVRNAWIMRSWDEFVVPRPWSRIVIVFAQPLRAEDYPSAQAFCEALQKALLAATDQAGHALQESR